jgi:hypothetical protein
MSKANRRGVLGTLLALCGILLVASFVSGQQSDQSNVKVASLQEQLEKGLKARRQVEFQFIARVVQLVNQGRLTREVVQGTFSFVTKKYQDRKYLVPIFEQALRKRVSQDGNTALNNVLTTL